MDDNAYRGLSLFQKIKKYALEDSIPAQAVRGALSGATLPGDVYAGRVDPNSTEAIRRSADLAGAATLGAGAVPAEAGAVRAGLNLWHGSPYNFNKFSADHIGSGTGAQAEGFGTYLTNSRAAANFYKNGGHYEYDPSMAANGVSPTLYKVEANIDPKRTLELDSPLHPDIEKAVREAYQVPRNKPINAVSDLEGHGLLAPPNDAQAKMLDQMGIGATKFRGIEEELNGYRGPITNYAVYNPDNLKILDRINTPLRGVTLNTIPKAAAKIEGLEVSPGGQLSGPLLNDTISLATSKLGRRPDVLEMRRMTPTQLLEYRNFLNSNGA